MLYIIIIFVLYSVNIVNCESYNKYSGYSNIFNSNLFNSNLFNSNLFNSNLFNSNLFNSIVFSYKKCLSTYSNKNYLTLYNSYDLKNSNTQYSFLSKSIKQTSSNKNYLTLYNSYDLKNSNTQYSFSTLPTLEPTTITTLEPTTITTLEPTTITTLEPTTITTLEPTTITTLEPTTITTLEPTTITTPITSLEPEKFIPILSIETSMTLSGLTEPSLDTKAQSAVLIAVASSINITTNYVLFLGQEVVARRKLIISYLLTTYNIKAITQINIPLINQYSNINPSIIYTSLTTNLENSISNGNFITFLIYASAALNSTSTQNVIVTNYSVSQMVLINNTLVPTLAPTSINSFNPSLTPTLTITISDPTKDFSVKELLTILFASIGSFIVVLTIYYYVKIKINKKEQPLSIQSLSIQPLSIQSLSIQSLSNEPLSIEPFISIQEEPPLSIQEEDIILSIND
jgi:hypothetical protein